MSDPGGRLAEDRRFFYNTDEEAGEPSCSRRHPPRLPGELGRRRAREHLCREAPELAASQIGLARADLQHRLSEASRTLARPWSGGTPRPRTDVGRLRAADELRGASVTEAADKERELYRRDGVIRHALAVLDETGSGQ